MHEEYFIFSADQENLPVRTQFAFGRCCPRQPLHLAGGTRRRVGVVGHVKQNRISKFPVNMAVTVTSIYHRLLAVAGPLVPLPLGWSGYSLAALFVPRSGERVYYTAGPT